MDAKANLRSANRASEEEPMEEKVVTEEMKEVPVQVKKSHEDVYWDEMERQYKAFHPDGGHPAQDILKDYYQLNQAASVNQKTLVVGKRAFSNCTRVLIIAGLEGTGHHALKDVLNYCFHKKICAKAANLTDILFHRTPANSLGLFGAADTSHYDLLLENTLSALLALSNSTNDAASQDDQLFIVGLETVNTAGMMSYPNYNDQYTKTLDRPDLLPLAILAEAANIDLRIIITQRRAYDILFSTHLRRGFGHGFEPRVLVDNAVALHRQMSQLDPNYLLCLPYHQSSQFNDTQLEIIRKFLHPRISTAIIQKMWTKFNPIDRSNTNVTAGSLDLHNPRRRYHHRKLIVDKRNPTVEEVAAMHKEMKLHQYNLVRLGWELDAINALCPPLLG